MKQNGIVKWYNKTNFDPKHGRFAAYVADNSDNGKTRTKLDFIKCDEVLSATEIALS